MPKTKYKHDPVNPRLRRAVASRRKSTLQIEAFKRVADAIAPFDEKTKRRALHAHLALFGN